MGPKSIIVQRTLSDIRDGNSYTIRKLADGNCWMTENLRLGKQNESITLTPSDSNVTSNYTLPKFTNGGSYSGEYVYVDSTWGGYYSWAAATAGSNPSSGNASTSICPKGWRLPTAGLSGEFSEFENLYNNFYKTAADLLDATNGPGFVLSGYRRGSVTYAQNGNGYYWSSRSYGSSLALNLSLTSSSVSTANREKYCGLSIRCIAR